MISDYKYKEIEKNLKDGLDRFEALTMLWSNVSYQTKKNGEPFKTLSKNITGAEVRQKIYASHSYEKELVVSDWTKKSGHVSDCIDLYEYANNDIRFLDLNDIKKKINKKIELYNSRIETLKYQIDHLQEVCEQCDEVKKHLRSLMGDTNMYSLATEYLKYIL